MTESTDELATTSMAPREIADLVYRCCRVADVEAGVAQRCAANVMHSEVHRSGGSASFLAAVQAGPDAVQEFATAPDVVEAAEVQRTSVEFVNGVAVAAVSAAIANAGHRGYVAVEIDYETPAIQRLSSLTFELRELSPARVNESRLRVQQAMRHGLAVPSYVAQALSAAAAGFLVAEHRVDAALDHG